MNHAEVEQTRYELAGALRELYGHRPTHGTSDDADGHAETFWKVAWQARLNGDPTTALDCLATAIDVAGPRTYLLSTLALVSHQRADPMDVMPALYAERAEQAFLAGDEYFPEGFPEGLRTPDGLQAELAARFLLLHVLPPDRLERDRQLVLTAHDHAQGMRALQRSDVNTAMSHFASVFDVGLNALTVFYAARQLFLGGHMQPAHRAIGLLDACPEHELAVLYQGVPKSAVDEMRRFLEAAQGNPDLAVYAPAADSPAAPRPQHAPRERKAQSITSPAPTNAPAAGRLSALGIPKARPLWRRPAWRIALGSVVAGIGASVVLGSFIPYLSIAITFAGSFWCTRKTHVDLAEGLAAALSAALLFAVLGVVASMFWSYVHFTGFNWFATEVLSNWRMWLSLPHEQALMPIVLCTVAAVLGFRLRPGPSAFRIPKRTLGTLVVALVTWALVPVLVQFGAQNDPHEVAPFVSAIRSLSVLSLLASIRLLLNASRSSERNGVLASA